MAKVDTELLKGFACPKCRLLVAARESQLGQKVKCPNCVAVLELPSSILEGDCISPYVSYQPQDESEHAELTTEYVDSWLEPVPDEVATEAATGLPWHTLVPAGLIGIALLAAVLLQLKGTSTRDAEPNLLSLEAGKETSKVKIDTIYEIEVLELLKKIYKVTSVEELMPFVIPTQGVEAKVTSYYTENRLSFREPDAVLSVDSVFGNAKNFAKVKVNNFVGDDVLYYVSRDSKGKLQLDWEAYVQWCEPSWDKIGNAEDTEVIVTRATRDFSSYYNHGYEASEWQACELTHKTQSKVYTGYVKRGSEAYAKLFPRIGYQSGEHVTLQVRRVNSELSTRQLVIEKVLSDHWITDFTE